MSIKHTLTNINVDNDEKIKFMKFFMILGSYYNPWKYVTYCLFLRFYCYLCLCVYVLMSLYAPHACMCAC